MSKGNVELPTTWWVGFRAVQTRITFVIGAHYDHLGFGSFGSLYQGDTPRIHNGADDNASGTAGLLELAHYFSEYPPVDNILLLAFSGEEIGLLGSAHYVEEPTVDLAQAKAMINLDMIGRMSDKNLLIFGVGTTPKWSELAMAVNEDSLNLNLLKMVQEPATTPVSIIKIFLYSTISPIPTQIIIALLTTLPTLKWKLKKWS